MDKPNTRNPEKQAELLQAGVASTIDVALTLKQLHWNIRGPKFQQIHEFLDVIIEHARAATDEMAERMVTLGIPSVGQRATLPKSSVPTIKDGFIDDDGVIQDACNALTECINTLRNAQEGLADIDAMTEDIVIGIVVDLEKDLWMMRSHLK